MPVRTDNARPDTGSRSSAAKSCRPASARGGEIRSIPRTNRANFERSASPKIEVTSSTASQPRTMLAVIDGSNCAPLAERSAGNELAGDARRPRKTRRGRVTSPHRFFRHLDGCLALGARAVWRILATLKLLRSWKQTTRIGMRAPKKQDQVESSARGNPPTSALSRKERGRLRAAP